MSFTLSNVLLICFQISPPSLLKLSLKRHTESAVRGVIHSQRIAEELRKALVGTETQGEIPSCFLLLTNGYFSTLAGEGPLFDEFVEKGTLGHFIGKNTIARKPDDPEYDKCKFRILTFDHCFTHCRKDAQDRKEIIHVITQFRI